MHEPAASAPLARTCSLLFGDPYSSRKHYPKAARTVPGMYERKKVRNTLCSKLRRVKRFLLLHPHDGLKMHVSKGRLKTSRNNTKNKALHAWYVHYFYKTEWENLGAEEKAIRRAQRARHGERCSQCGCVGYFRRNCPTCPPVRYNGGADAIGPLTWQPQTRATPISRVIASRSYLFCDIAFVFFNCKLSEALAPG